MSRSTTAATTRSRRKAPAKAEAPLPAEAETPATEPLAQAESPTVLTGRLCFDPQLRQTKTGIPVTTLRLAVNKPDADPDFHDVIVFRKQAEVVCRYLKKGRLVEIRSNTAPHERTWIGRDGQERRTSEVVAYRVDFLSRSAQAQQQAESERAVA